MAGKDLLETVLGDVNELEVTRSLSSCVSGTDKCYMEHVEKEQKSLKRATRRHESELGGKDEQTASLKGSSTSSARRFW